MWNFYYVENLPDKTSKLCCDTMVRVEASNHEEAASLAKQFAPRVTMPGYLVVKAELWCAAKTDVSLAPLSNVAPSR